VHGLQQGFVQLQQRLAAGEDDVAVGGVLAPAARPAASANLPPPWPSVPTKSVSQKVQAAPARSLSRPVQRLQPAKRQKTAARPACAPSPCRVLKSSLTE